MADDNKITEGNTIGNVSSIETNGQIGIRADSTPFAECFYFQDFYDESSIKKFAKNVEKLIRTSREYNEYIELLRTNCTDLNHDNIMHNITNGDVDLEFHHYPFTLYDIVVIVMNKHVIDAEKFTSFSIAKEVMKLHYAHKIGLVPLTKTNHELAHDGKLFISEKQIFGDFHKFMKEYDKGITIEQKSIISELEKMSSENIPSDIGGIL